MTILIVEDDPNIAELWRRYLLAVTEDGEIRQAPNLVEALQQMSVMPPPDCVLLDLKMPGTTPENTLQHISELKRVNPNAVVLVITGMTDENLPKLAAQLGADDFQQKRELASQGSLVRAIRDCFDNQIKKSQPPISRSIEMLQRLNTALGIEIQ